MCEDTRYLYGISAWVYNYYQKSQQAGQITQIDRKAGALLHALVQYSDYLHAISTVSLLC